MNRNTWIVQARAVLQKVEWAIEGITYPGCELECCCGLHQRCPTCGGLCAEGHKPKCRLAALLKELPE